MTISAKTDSEGHGGVRNNYFRHKTMRAEEFRIEQKYHIEHRRLLNRAMFGEGVVYGFGLDEKTPNRVHPGFALDRHGQELVLHKEVNIAFADVMWLMKAGDSWVALDNPREVPDYLKSGNWILAAHYAEEAICAVDPDGGSCGTIEYKFQGEGVVFSLRKREGGTCPCAEPGKPECKCLTLDTCGNENRGPHRRLCDWVTHAEPNAAGKPCKWEDGSKHPHSYLVYPNSGVDLACVTITFDGLGDPHCSPTLKFSDIDGCSPRRIVKNNNLLYDLIRGRDLTRVQEVNWAEWVNFRAARTTPVVTPPAGAPAPKSVPWADLKKKFGCAPHPESSSKWLTDFVVKFSCSVQTETLTQDVFAISILSRVEETFWRTVSRVPVVGVWPVRKISDTLTDEVRIVVDRKWYENQIAGNEECPSKFRDNTTVEIEIRGGLIRDCNDQTVDANGTGTPGSIHFSSFDVTPSGG